MWRNEEEGERSISEKKLTAKYPLYKIKYRLPWLHERRGKRTWSVDSKTVSRKKEHYIPSLVLWEFISNVSMEDDEWSV